jgi:3-hydroxyacyl-CoA dehydrogenase
VIEAVREHLPTKREVFAEISRLNQTAYLAGGEARVAAGGR